MKYMYEINVLTPCDNEEEKAVVICATMHYLQEENTTPFNIRPIRRTNTNTPVWNIYGRQERFQSKL